MDGDLPAHIPLNEVDHFLLQLDRSMRQAGGGANVCTFVVTLRGHLTRKTLQRDLETNPVYRWMTRLRLSQRLLRRAGWKLDEKADLPDIQVHSMEESGSLPVSLLATDLDVAGQTPLKVDLLHDGGRASRLIFTWHHTLMDAHGGEFLVRHLGGSLTQLPSLRQSQQPPPYRSLGARASIAREMKTNLYDASKPPLLVLHDKNKPAGALRYRVIPFSLQQTWLIEERCRLHGGAFFTSAFCLAAVACALADLQQQRGVALEDALLPVPQDRRRRGAVGPVIGNQVSFLFYRLPVEVLGDLASCTAGLVAQLQNFIRSRAPEHYFVMMGLLRHLPGPLYRTLLRSPTKGLMGSCFFSDTGEVLPGCKTLFGHELLDAVHYPPNVYPPGLTFVFSRFREQFRVTFAYMDGVIEAHEGDHLLTALRRRLLGDADDTV